jgi:hypothetical protein
MTEQLVYLKLNQLNKKSIKTWKPVKLQKNKFLIVLIKIWVLSILQKRYPL